jgi:hypothetical protein
MTLREVLPTTLNQSDSQPDVSPELSRAYESHVAHRVFQVYCQLRMVSLAVQSTQASLDEQMRLAAQQRIEDEIRTQREMPGIWHPVLEAKR